MATFKIYDGTNWVELAKASDYVNLTGTQTISGTKTFSSPVYVHATSSMWNGSIFNDTANSFIGFNSSGQIGFRSGVTGTTVNSAFTFRVGDNNRLRIADDNIRPETDNSYTLGLSGQRFKDLYLSGGIKNGTYTWSMPSSTGTLALTTDITKANVGLSNVANERQYSANNPPPYPVTSVNGSTGAITGLAEVSGTTNMPLFYTSVSSLPQFSGSPYYLLGIEAFSSGGQVKWQEVSSINISSFNDDIGIALTENVVNLSATGTQTIYSSGNNVPIIVKGGISSDCAIGFKDVYNTELGYFGVMYGNKPYFYNPVNAQQSKLIRDSDLQYDSSTGTLTITTT